MTTPPIPDGFTVQFSLTGSYFDFERLIKRVYGKSFEFVEDQECGNDSHHKFTVKKSPLDAWDKATLDTFKTTGRGTFLSHMLFQDLVNNDVIPEGTYLIHVSW